MLNSWRKVLSVTDIGEGGTHDKYLNIPKKIVVNGQKVSPFVGTDKNPAQFYNRQPGRPGRKNWVFVDHIDKKTSDIYKVRFEYARVSKQTRLYRLAECYNARKPKAGDEIVVEKITVDGETNFIVDIVRKGSSLNVLSKSEIEKSLKSKKIFIKKPKVNIFLDKINPALEKYSSGKARTSTDIIRQAEIYKITFTIDKKTFAYVGQDSLCRGENYYFGSSILTGFCELVYGEQIFKKRILHTLENIMQKDLNKKEWECIYDARAECKKKGWYNINKEVQNY